MYELTKEQKNKIYKRALAEIQSGKNNFLCPAIKFAWCVVMDEKYPEDNIIGLFTEFLAYKPINPQFPYWFRDENGNAERKMILENCIKQTS